MSLAHLFRRALFPTIPLSAAWLTLTFADAVSGAVVQGPSTGSTPYAVPVDPRVTTYSIATVDNTGANPDDVFPKTGGGSYGMTGIPDGLGAFDNGDRTFTVLMNHELGNTAGTVRAHGSIGAFVSQWVINKDTLAVVSAKDMINSVVTWNTGTSTYNAPGTTAFGRLCSADLPAVTAFSNGPLGTTERIFMSGEENGTEGRAFAHIVTGSNAGVSYELPRLGKFSWENAVASPYQQNKTIVMGLDDQSGTNQGVYMYVGTKTNTGSEIDKAGLTNGLLYGIKIDDLAPQLESRTTDFGIGKGNTKGFSLVLGPNGGNVSTTTGNNLDIFSNSNGISSFLRPEDGAWDTLSNNKFYFATTDRYDQVKDGVGVQVGRSRLWSLTFDDITNPTLGGDIELLLDGSENLNMMDNIGVDSEGNILIVEDVGGQAHNGKIARFNPTTGVIEILAQHDPARFGNIGLGATSPYNNDEEFSGVIDLSSIMADSLLSQPNGHWYLFDDQAHYSLGGSQVEGGQLLLIQLVAAPEPASSFLLAAGAVMLVNLRRRKPR
jgi:hypothetical protein